MDLASEWRSLLSPDEVSPDACRQFAASLREKKLTFGDRLHCPFLRPFLLTGQDEERIRTAAETIASAGERVAKAAMASRTLLHELGMTDPEIGLATIDPGTRRRAPLPAWTRSFCPTRCTSPSTTPNRRQAWDTPRNWRRSSTGCG